MTTVEELKHMMTDLKHMIDKIVDEEMIERGDAIRCSNCNTPIILYKNEKFRHPKTVTSRLCDNCLRDSIIEYNRDRIMEILEHAKIIDLKPTDDDSDTMGEITVQSPDGICWVLRPYYGQIQFRRFVGPVDGIKREKEN